LIVWCCVSLLPGNEICAECNAGDFWLGDSAAKNEKERIGKCVEFINGLTPEQRKSLLAFLKHIKREINDFFGGMPIPIEALWYFMIVHGERLEEPEWPR
jgi:hypothetical protein